MLDCYAGQVILFCFEVVTDKEAEVHRRVENYDLWLIFTYQEIRLGQLLLLIVVNNLVFH